MVFVFSIIYNKMRLRLFSIGVYLLLAVSTYAQEYKLSGQIGDLDEKNQVRIVF